MWTSSKQWRWLQRVQVFGRWTPSIVGWGWVHHLGPLDSDAFTSSLFIHLFDLCFIIWRSKQLGERDTLLPCWPWPTTWWSVGWELLVCSGLEGLKQTRPIPVEYNHTLGRLGFSKEYASHQTYLTSKTSSWAQLHDPVNQNFTPKPVLL